MMKEINHRFGFYLISALMIVMLFFIYLDVKRLNADVDALLDSAQATTPYDAMFLEQMKNSRVNIVETDDNTDEVLEEDVPQSEEPTNVETDNSPTDENLEVGL